MTSDDRIMQFNLNDKIKQFEDLENYYLEKDVKEFIRLLKEKLHFTKEELDFINELAGDELIWLIRREVTKKYK